MSEEVLPVPLTYLARIPFWLMGKRPIVPPQKALIVQPGPISHVMFTTPLLASLSQAFPKTRFDWLVSEWGRQAIVGNPRLTEIINTGKQPLNELPKVGLQEIIHQLQKTQYDTCFIPHRSSWFSWFAWKVGIPQRVGLNVEGRGFAHTVPVRLPVGEKHEAALYLALAAAVGVDLQTVRAGMEFYPADADRTAVTRQLVDDMEWLGDCPLVILHPGGGGHPAFRDEQKRWPVERFALLGSYLWRQHRARVLLVGAEEERPLLQTVSGMMAVPSVNLGGRFTLGELGALCEVADLYVGNDTGPTHVAAAVGCSTIHICGPSDPAISSPYVTKGKAVSLWREVGERPFSWGDGVTVEEVCQTADKFLRPGP